MTATPAHQGTPLMSIGEVLAILRPEFPDTTISKLRFLEAEGLIEPQRTASGYRKYSDQDVARLRYILIAQREHYLPLRIIRQHLDEGVHLVEPTAAESPQRIRPALVAVDSQHLESQYREPSEARLSRADLCRRADITDEMLTDFEQHGLITARAGSWYDEDALTIAQVAGQLTTYGLQARHLRAYRVAADREVGLFAQLLTPLVRQQDATARARATEAVHELTALSALLHAALLRAGLGGALGR